MFAFSAMLCYNVYCKKLAKEIDPMAQERISEKQQEILNFIKEQLLSKGYPPSVREICDAVNLSSTSSVHNHLNALEKNGYIRRDSSKTRAIEIVDEDFDPGRREMASIPIVGTVAAGEPLLAEQNIDDYFAMPVDMLPSVSNQELFMLKVKGESMIDMGILDGDKVLCVRSETARNGEVVVALVEDSATVKRFYKEDGHYRLQPENADMDPIIVDNCSILGKVIGLLRLNIQ